jgi:hypothetical protein
VHPTMKTTSTLRGFTPVELLAVIATACTIAALLLPVLGKAKVKRDEKKARAAVLNLLSESNKQEVEIIYLQRSLALVDLVPHFKTNGVRLVKIGQPSGDPVRVSPKIVAELRMILKKNPAKFLELRRAEKSTPTAAWELVSGKETMRIIVELPFPASR